MYQVIKAHMELLPIQRTVEFKAVAEHLHFKISTLLLHSGKEGEAVKWFKQHIVRYKCLIGPPEGAFLHWAWVCKQFQVFAELLDNSLATASLPPASGQSTGTPVTVRELQPGYYLQVNPGNNFVQCFYGGLVGYDIFVASLIFASPAGNIWFDQAEESHIKVIG